MKPSHVKIVAAALALLLCTTSQSSQAAKTSLQQKIDHARFCSDLKDAYDENMAYYNQKPSQRGQWKATADNLKTLAEGNNCGWATGMTSPSGLSNGPNQDWQIAPLTEETRAPSRGNPGGTLKFN